MTAILGAEYLFVGFNFIVGKPRWQRGGFTLGEPGSHIASVTQMMFENGWVGTVPQ